MDHGVLWRSVCLVSLVGLALAGCASGTGRVTLPAERTIYMAALQPKGEVDVTSKPFPPIDLPGGGGYALKPPDERGRWEVEAFLWSPGTVVVNQGDEVTLEIVGVDGDEHPSTIEGYGIDFLVKRGEITRVSFTAERAGIFTIRCNIHLPSMQASLIVLSAS